MNEDVEGSKMFYKIMKNKNRSTERAKSMKDENGKVVENGEDIREIIAEIFSNVVKY